MLFLIAGDPFTGKTVSACTFPKPLLYVDFDDGFSSVFYAKDKTGKLIVEDIARITIERMVVESISELSFVSAKDKGGSPPPHAKNSYEVVRKFNAMMKALDKDPQGYQTLVIDSLTTFFRIWKDAILHINNIPSLRISDYQTLESVLCDQFIPSLKVLKIPYIVLIDHVDMDKDEITGQIVEFPIGTSRAVGRTLGKHMDELYRQRNEGGDYVWKTRKTGFFQAGSRLSVPDTIKANFSELEKYLKKS